MKIRINEANLGPYKYRYEVRGNGILYGAAKDIKEAEQIMMDQAYDIFDSPWEDNRTKFRKLSAIHIVDSETGSTIGPTTPDDYLTADDYVDNLMSELHSRMRMESAFKRHRFEIKGFTNGKPTAFIGFSEDYDQAIESAIKYRDTVKPKFIDTILVIDNETGEKTKIY